MVASMLPPIANQVTATLQEGDPSTISGEKEATPAFFKPLVDSQLINCEGTWHGMSQVRMELWTNHLSITVDHACRVISAVQDKEKPRA